MALHVSLSYGELLDKLTILEIKSERITDSEKLCNVRNEKEVLNNIWRASNKSRLDINEELKKLKEINESLWEIEDNIREKERQMDFGEEFIQLARSVYFINDERARVKREINIKLGSEIIEEKSYQDYSRSGMEAEKARPQELKSA